MDFPSLVDALPEFLLDEAVTLKGESIEIVEWKAVREKIVDELKKEPQLMEKMKLLDDDVPFLGCLLTSSTVKKMIGEYASKCKQQIEVGTSGKKNTTKATSIRLQGNSLFAKNEYGLALKMFTRGLMFAKDGDEETPLLYANRSAVYFYLKQHENALEDIERALKFGYGKINPTGKLLIRKGFSLLALERDDLAKELLDANMPANEDEPDFAQWQGLKKESENVNRQIIKHDITLSQFQDVSTIRTALINNDVFRPHERFPWLNGKVDLCYDEKEKDFHLVTKEEMKYGEIVALSKPYFSLDSKRDSYERCHYCMVPCFESPKYFSAKANLVHEPKLSLDSLRMVTPLACPECSNVLYCSEACRTTAWTAYHRLECSQMAILRKIDSESHLALRMLYMIGSLEENSSTELMINEFKTTEDPYALMIDQQAYSFVYSNRMPESIYFETKLELSLSVCFLLKLLHTSAYLLAEPKNIDDKGCITKASRICILLSRYLHQVELNETVSFTDTIMDHTVTPSHVLFVDGMTAMLKHSCEATVATSSVLRESLDSNVKLLYATGAIPAGTVLTLAYDLVELPNFEIIVRQAQLRIRYNIYCTCTRCVREQRDCLDISTGGVYYPIGCSLCGSLMVRAAGEDSWQCSSTDGCTFKYSAQQMKNVYEQVKTMMVAKDNAELYPLQTYRTLQPKVKQLKTTIESTAQLLYGRSFLLAQMYTLLANCYLFITMVPISNHTRVHRDNLTTALLYTNKAFDILESMKQGPLIQTALAFELNILFEQLDAIKFIILKQLLVEMLPPIEQAKGRYEALLKMTAFDTMVASSLCHQE